MARKYTGKQTFYSVVLLVSSGKNIFNDILRLGCVHTFIEINVIWGDHHVKPQLTAVDRGSMYLG